MTDKMTLDEFHMKIAKETNNGIWSTLDKENPSTEELEKALYMAHTSTFHWSKVGKPINIARGEYMISRVLSALGRGESSLAHAEKSLRIAEGTDAKDWDIAFAYEAITRAYVAIGDKKKSNEWKEKTRKAIESVKEEEDRQICLGEFEKIKF